MICLCISPSLQLPCENHVYQSLLISRIAVELLMTDYVTRYCSTKNWRRRYRPKRIQYSCAESCRFCLPKDIFNISPRCYKECLFWQKFNPFLRFIIPNTSFEVPIVEFSNIMVSEFLWGALCIFSPCVRIGDHIFQIYIIIINDLSDYDLSQHVTVLGMPCKLTYCTYP